MSSAMSAALPAAEPRSSGSSGTGSSGRLTRTSPSRQACLLQSTAGDVAVEDGAVCRPYRHRVADTYDFRDRTLESEVQLVVGHTMGADDYRVHGVQRLGLTRVY